MNQQVRQSETLDPRASTSSIDDVIVDGAQALLNLGCGSNYHRDWVNLDLAPVSSEVTQCNITQGIPFQAGSFDAVYHSHVLEHLSQEQGIHLLKECLRILKPGGILRIVVPDLEQIAELYLQSHQQAWKDENLDANYQWMKLELLDQLVRNQSGGQMGRYIATGRISNEEFVRSRLGEEFQNCIEQENFQPTVTIAGRISASVSRFKHKMARRVVRWLLGWEAQQAFDEGMFRSQGEVHRWMYDRYSLRQLCSDCGFQDFRVCDAFSSGIAQFSDYQLDCVGDRTRKPDSLFIECKRPS